MLAEAIAAVLCVGLGGCISSGTTNDPTPNGKGREGNDDSGPVSGSDLATTEFDSTRCDAADTAMDSFAGEPTEATPDCYKERHAYTAVLMTRV